MSQIKNNKNEEFVKTNHNSEDKAKSHEFGYWKSLKDISSEKDYNQYLNQLFLSLSPNNSAMKKC